MNVKIKEALTKMISQENLISSIADSSQSVREEVKVNTTVTSCLYIKIQLMNVKCKFLLDTGSPYSILSNQVYEKINEPHSCQANSTRLRAADGSLIQTNGQIMLKFDSNGHCFKQTFIVAKIQGIDGIIGGWISYTIMMVVYRLRNKH